MGALKPPFIFWNELRNTNSLFHCTPSWQMCPVSTLDSTYLFLCLAPITHFVARHRVEKGTNSYTVTGPSELFLFKPYHASSLPHEAIINHILTLYKINSVSSFGFHGLVKLKDQEWPFPSHLYQHGTLSTSCPSLGNRQFCTIYESV